MVEDEETSCSSGDFKSYHSLYDIYKGSDEYPFPHPHHLGYMNQLIRAITRLDLYERALNPSVYPYINNIEQSP